MKLFAFVDSNATYFFSLQLKLVARFPYNIWVYDYSFDVLPDYFALKSNNIFVLSIIAVEKIFPGVG